MTTEHELEAMEKRLRDFPKFISHDRGVHWLNSGEKEPLCIEAADLLATLRTLLAGRSETIEECAAWKQEANDAHAKIALAQEKLTACYSWLVDPNAPYIQQRLQLAREILPFIPERKT